MPNRVQLTWDRNQDVETDHYRLFRSEYPTINEQNRMDYLIMRVAHPKNKNPIRIQDELLIRYSSKVYMLRHKHILPFLNGDVFPFLIEIDGVVVTGFTLDTVKGQVMFDNDISPLSVVKAKDYTFDGVEVWDYGIEEVEKTYYGPEAKDTSAPEAPPNLTMSTDHDKNRIVLRWGTSKVQGKTFFYQIDSAVDNTRYSKLSERQVGIVREPLADRPYLMERSLDGIKWQEIAKIKGTVFYEYMVDRQAPDPIKNLRGTSYLYASDGLAQVTLKWDRVSDTVDSKTPLYRLRSVNRVGAISDPSNIVGPVPFKVDMKEIVIRRKVYDGTLPSLDGDDAVTAARTTDLSTTVFTEDVEDNHKYTYAVWVVDIAGNASPISYVAVEIGDATAPIIPLNLSVEPFQLIVG